MNKFILIKTVPVAFILFFSFSKICYADTTYTIRAQEDLYIESNHPDTKTWNQRNLYLGQDYLYNKGKTQIYMKFDLSDFKTAISDNPNRINSATLNIYNYISQSSSSYEIKLHETTSEWSQYNVTWNNPPELGRLISSTTFTSTDSEWKEVDLTLWLKKMTSEEYNSTGIAIISTQESQPGGVFWSTSCHLPNNPPICEGNFQPKLVINYENNTPPQPGNIISPQNSSITSSEVIEFKWSEGSDNEDDSLTHSLQISSNPSFSNILISNNTQTSTEITIPQLETGSYYARIIYSDGEFESISNTINFKVDRESPPTPEILALPPITNSDQINVKWMQVYDNNLEDVEYQICHDISKSFSNPVCTSWILENYFTLTNAIDNTTYYFKVKARDSLSNETIFSNNVETLVDLSKPSILNFAVSEKLLSLSKPNKETIKLQKFHGKINEPNLESWLIEVYNSNQKIIKSFSGHKNKIELNWKLKDLKDGKYFTRLIATDRTNKLSRSNFRSFQIDSTPPKLTYLDYPKTKEPLSTKNIVLTFQSEKNSNYKIYLNQNKIANNIIGTSNGLVQLPIILKEGRNLIKIELEDKALNKTIREVNLVTDTRPPKAPSLNILKLDPNKVTLSAKAEVGSKITFYISGFLVKEQIVSKRLQKTTLNYTFHRGVKYQIYAKLEDQSGNVSKLSKSRNLKLPLKNEFGIGCSGEETEDSKSMPPGICEISIHKDKKILAPINCKIPAPQISQIKRYSSGNKKEEFIDVYGNQLQSVDIQVNYTDCKEKSFWDPRTWYGCVDTPAGSETFTIEDPLRSIKLLFESDKTELPGAVYYKQDGTNFKQTHQLEAKLLEKQLTATTYIYIDFKPKHYKYIDFYMRGDYSQPFAAPSETKITKTEKYFRFPLAQLTNVTQWHGYTKYENPHTGIDFATKRDKVIAPADGVVKFRNWDSYGGKCNSGGNGLRIKHPNGMNTVYFHLDSYKQSNGKLLKLNQEVKKGQQIAISGNTGYFNCKPLGYHLHFELRKGRWQKTHTDPVPYIDVNWNSIKTAHADLYPDRLTGDNPHPEY